MFLQGTASVYSKKVEYLWQSVLSMMALLASKKALDEVEGADGPGLPFFFFRISHFLFKRKSSFVLSIKLNLSSTLLGTFL